MQASSDLATSAEHSENLILRLDGFEGPMDLLLDLARAQKVDLAKISILSLVDQYLAAIEGTSARSSEAASASDVNPPLKQAELARSSEAASASDVNPPLKQAELARSSEAASASDVNRPLKQAELARSSEADAASDVNRPLQQNELGPGSFNQSEPRPIRLELAADWLVMAAWLTWLKSRLLLPPTANDDLENGETAADALTARLQELNVIRTLAAWLAARPMLGQDVFARGVPERHHEYDRSRIIIEPGPFVRAYLEAVRRGTKASSYTPRALTLWTMQDALRRLTGLLGSLPDWTTLEQFLPDHIDNPAERRAALSSTLLASLEMARCGALRLRQEAAFGPILVRHGNGDDDQRA